MHRLKILMAMSTILLAGSAAFAESCALPDYGYTVSFPPPCPVGYEGPMVIVDGLPPGTTIEIEASLSDFMIQFEGSGGSLGGHVHQWDAILNIDMTGTGELAGFQRMIGAPVSGEIHTGPRNSGDAVQDFENEMIFMMGDIFGDPDFDQLGITAGTVFGLPSPGHSVVSQLPDGEWNVDSFFDITYRIEFVGAPGSILDGLAGSTTGTDRFQMGEPYIPVDSPCVLADNGSGTVDFPPDCPDGYLGPLSIVDGLPPGTTIEIEASLRDFMVTLEGPGGILGGEFQVWDATLVMDMTGTGELAGFTRHIEMPVLGETNTGPRRDRPDPFQDFLNELMRANGEKYGDPDFGIIEYSAGTDLGLPSPGETVLHPLPDGNFNVDSFFDITYQIEFEGAPGSALDGFAGTTTGTERFTAGSEYIEETCNLPDNGNGTVDFPPECPDGYQGEILIVDGLPPDWSIHIDATLSEFANIVRMPGGDLEGEVQSWDAVLYLDMIGLGGLEGFARNIQMYVEGVTETAPLGGGVLSFATELVSLEGGIFGDPDFDYIELRAGRDFGLPSPGHTVLTDVGGGDFAVDSFFDIFYEIEFAGAPGSIFDGMAGLTHGMNRFEIGHADPTAADEAPAASEFALFANIPNPFNPSTKIRYYVPENGGHISLDIYDISGRRVLRLANGFQAGGMKSIVWNGKDDRGRAVSSGVYFYRLGAEDFSEARKMTVLK